MSDQLDGTAVATSEPAAPSGRRGRRAADVSALVERAREGDALILHVPAR